MRIVIVAFLICALAFVAGVAGDLSLAAQPNAGESVVVHIPAGAVRAHPLPAVAYETTESADAEPVIQHPVRPHRVARGHRVKPHRHAGKIEAKTDVIAPLKGAFAPSALV